MNNIAEIIFEINESINFNDIKKEGISLFLFGADWCKPYLIQKDIFQATYENLKDKAKFAIVDIDINIELAIEQSITSLPSLLITKDGVIIDKLVGVVSQNVVEEKIRNLI